MGEITTAQYCRNGHEITSDLKDHPEKAAKFCPQCGAATLSACEHCTAPIRGLQISGYGFVTSTPRGNH